jgi:hypothetical protein
MTILHHARIGKRDPAPSHQLTANSAEGMSIVRYRAIREMAQVIADATRRDEALARLEMWLKLATGTTHLRQVRDTTS